ncbi:hypothetical protein GGR54DRAFT_99578 [Hypoxylon sp. NC1633]|nr:hypothetical protein GGR54DRAFT_99578 [Hypoxylon sp. NC1633]
MSKVEKRLDYRCECRGQGNPSATGTPDNVYPAGPAIIRTYRHTWPGTYLSPLPSFLCKKEVRSFLRVLPVGLSRVNSCHQYDRRRNEDHRLSYSYIVLYDSIITTPASSRIAMWQSTIDGPKLRHGSSSEFDELGSWFVSRLLSRRDACAREARCWTCAALTRTGPPPVDSGTLVALARVWSSMTKEYSQGGIEGKAPHREPSDRKAPRRRLR